MAHAEQELAESRSHRLAAETEPHDRLAAFIREYLPDDQHDPVWKLWIEGWLRSPSREAFASVGEAADRQWHSDLTAALEHAAACGIRLAEPAADLARRLLFLLDGLALHVLAEHITVNDAISVARTTIDCELRPA